MFQRYLMVGVALIVSGLVGWQAYGWLNPPKSGVSLTDFAPLWLTP